jgi:predicted transcriptional regulator
MSIPEQLRTIAEKAIESKRPQKVTPRQILSWYGYARRGSWITDVIRSHIKELGAWTFPSFAGAYIDSPIFIAELKQENGTKKSRENTKDDVATKEEDCSTSIESMHQISRLKAANTSPVRVSPNDTLSKAITLMQLDDFSQLPVMNSDREVKGMISWQSIGSKLADGQTCTEVRECMGEFQVVPDTESILRVINTLKEHDSVLVKGHDNTITGIVTAADISEQFQILAEPFLLLGDIETHVRHLIEKLNLPNDELKKLKNENDTQRKIENVGDLTFGEYMRALGREEYWTRLNLHFDRTTFAKRLDEIREIRNDVMHFDPDGIDENKLTKLRTFANFLEDLFQE